MYIFKTEPRERNYVKISVNDLISKTDSFLSTNQVSLDLHLEENDNMIVIPCTYEPGQKNKFEIIITGSENISITKLQKWHTEYFPGVWTSSKSGGCTNFETWLNNPKCLFVLKEPSEVVLDLNQKSDKVPAGMYIVEKTKGKELHKNDVIEFTKNFSSQMHSCNIFWKLMIRLYSHCA